MPQLKLFKVRDLRKKEQFIIDDAYLNSWARHCGTPATLVYLSLCRHADKEQKAFPSQRFIADELGINVRTVKRGLKALQKYNIVQTEQEREKGKFTNYIYYLVDKSQWNKPPGDKKCLRSHQGTKTDSGPPPYGLSPTKDAHYKDAHLKDNSMSQEATDWNLEKEIQKVLEDKRRHIQIIGVWIEEIRLRPENTEQIQSIIRRNLRPARLLNGYTNEDIHETIEALKNTEYLRKFTLETVLKYIDEVVAQKKKEGPKIIRFEEVRQKDGSVAMRPIYTEKLE
ncbi:hypothetical protein COT64_02580 [Candidatus Shapirobacteria bacterium CG09_land_8_20_14_0_10_39_12]|uniref:Helix-turn-helix domain-containing protein n=1 Tax=Candidatus Shapirobacteria bacterium CG09_land_8_20_14_0_10_39_12 TaxID=1974885 RepID=A0A2H0WPB6_9BACT|nr:MAG: hypothetical protein COT64_02580 [Candidatus Shapirobacteria bacterium CG09_land_8_20_14_0_10_39_12]